MNDRSFEVYTWAAGVAALTEQIQIFTTSHLRMLHPVMAAKQGATLDPGNGQIVYLVQPEPNAQQARNRGISIARPDLRATIGGHLRLLLGEAHDHPLETRPVDSEVDVGLRRVGRGVGVGVVDRAQIPALCLNHGSSPRGIWRLL